MVFPLKPQFKKIVSIYENILLPTAPLTFNPSLIYNWYFAYRMVAGVFTKVLTGKEATGITVLGECIACEKSKYIYFSLKISQKSNRYTIYASSPKNHKIMSPPNLLEGGGGRYKYVNLRSCDGEHLTVLPCIMSWVSFQLAVPRYVGLHVNVLICSCSQ